MAAGRATLAALRTVRVIGIGRLTQISFDARFGIPITRTLSLTETADKILDNPLLPETRKIGSPGLGYGCKMRILTTDLVEASRDIEGEIAVRGSNVMLQFLDNFEATASAFSGEVLQTGDLGRVDTDGYAFVTGHLKELTIKRGENIAPREVDEVL